MNRLSRLLRAANWKYALGEIAIVALGILLALWVSTWEQRRSARAVEMKTLRELHAALAFDLRSIANYLESFQESQRSASILLAHIEQGLPYHDSLDAHFGKLRSGDLFTAHSAPYETLKSRGLETITDDSLRLAVAGLHDVTYDRLEQLSGMTLRQFENTLQPFYIGRFRNLGTFESATPLSPDSILADPALRGVVENVLLYRRFILPQFEGATREIEALRAALQRAIQQRE